MSDSPHWSLYFARLRRIHVRFHALFAAVAVCLLFISTSGTGEPAFGLGVLAVVVLALSVMAHEAGHVCAAVRVGGTVEQVVLGPLGGLPLGEPLREPQAEFITALAGPLVSLSLMMLALPVLLATEVSVPALLNPLQPQELLAGGTWLVLVKLVFWTNWVLLLANLLPAYPLDGARILRSLLCPALDARSAGLVAVQVSKITAIGLCVLAWFASGARSAEILPVWVPLVLLAVWIVYAAGVEKARLEESDWEDELFSYDFSQGYTSLERAMEPQRRPTGSVRRWLEQRREMRRRKRQWQEQEEERQVDDILIRLHEKGMQGLSAKERAVLHRVSQRYRNRLSN